MWKRVIPWEGMGAGLTGPALGMSSCHVQPRRAWSPCSAASEHHGPPAAPTQHRLRAPQKCLPGPWPSGMPSTSRSAEPTPATHPQRETACNLLPAENRKPSPHQPLGLSLRGSFRTGGNSKIKTLVFPSSFVPGKSSQGREHVPCQRGRCGCASGSEHTAAVTQTSVLSHNQIRRLFSSLTA